MEQGVSWEQEQKCPECSSPGYVNEYDGDDDAYGFICDKDAEHRWWATCDDEVWK